MAVFRHSIHPQKSCGFFLYIMGELDTHMNEHIQAAVSINEEKNIVKVELSNFENKIEAFAATDLIISALAHTTGIEIIESPFPMDKDKLN